MRGRATVSYIVDKGARTTGGPPAIAPNCCAHTGAGARTHSRTRIHRPVGERKRPALTHSAAHRFLPPAPPAIFTHTRLCGTPGSGIPEGKGERDGKEGGACVCVSRRKETGAVYTGGGRESDIAWSIIGGNAAMRGLPLALVSASGGKGGAAPLFPRRSSLSGWEINEASGQPSAVLAACFRPCCTRVVCAAATYRAASRRPSHGSRGWWHRVVSAESRYCGGPGHWAQRCGRVQCSRVSRVYSL